ncbi:MAG: imidazoleglycerol-phosphate dehydratase HisB [Deltaproteobacteria bacterium]|nr:imidazoleglycerol-phosphate dehydratase HisB [Deltaproteobacteria bacterium]
MDTSAPGFIELERKTRETSVKAALSLYGEGRAEVETSIGFLDHMLTLFAVHGRFDLAVTATGDTGVDYHHTVEDVGIVLGDILSRFLDKGENLARYGEAKVPMDEALAEAVVDLSRRPFLVFDAAFGSPLIGGFDTQLFEEFFRALAHRAGITLHLRVLYGKNDHHRIEAVFKAFGRALAKAFTRDERVRGVLSSKGVL